MLGLGKEDFTLHWIDLGRQFQEGGTELVLRNQWDLVDREAEQGYSTQEQCEMWPTCSKRSYFHDHFKTPSLEVLELKFSNVESQRAPEAKLSSPTLLVQFWSRRRRQGMGILKLLKLNCIYWVIFLLHTWVPPDRAIDEKESEEV